MRNSWKPMFVLVLILLLALHSNSEASLETYGFTGTVNSTSFQMRSPLDLFNIGDEFNGVITFDDVAKNVTSIRYQVGTSGDYFSYEINDWTGRSSMVMRTLPDTFIFATNPSGFADNWTLVFDDVAPSSGKFFSHHFEDSLGVVYNFNADISSVNVVPIPAAVWLLGTGIAGIAALRRKVQK